jgi:hypothetical protein
MKRFTQRKPLRDYLSADRGGLAERRRYYEEAIMVVGRSIGDSFLRSDGGKGAN